MRTYTFSRHVDGSDAITSYPGAHHLLPVEVRIDLHKVAQAPGKPLNPDLLGGVFLVTQGNHFSLVFDCSGPTGMGCGRVIRYVFLGRQSFVFTLCCGKAVREFSHGGRRSCFEQVRNFNLQTSCHWLLTREPLKRVSLGWLPSTVFLCLKASAGSRPTVWNLPQGK